MAVAAASGLAAGAARRVEPIVRPLPLAAATRKAGLAALVMLGLSVPITAIRTDQSPSGLLLIQRPHIVALAILIVFAFALAHAVRLRRPERLGGPGLANRAAVLLGLAALFAGAHGATTAVSARVGAALLPGVPLALMPEAQWFVLSAVILGLLLIQGVVVPLVPGLVEATRRKRASSEMDAITTRAAPASRPGFAFARLATPFCLGLALLFPLLAFQASGGLSESRYWIDLGILILTYVMLGWGLNIVVGLAGLLDLGYVAFYAVGAYSYALLATTFGLSFWICLPVAGLLAAFWGILLGFPVLRLRGDYLAIVTLAFGEIIRLVLINWVDVTGGGAGISSIPRVTFFGVPFTAEEDGFAALFGLAFSPMHRIIFLYYLILALALLTNLVTVRLRRLPIGRAWEALREDEIACRSLGINTTVTKLTAFAIGAMFGGFAGSFFAVRQGFISPESFNFLESATILAIVVLGGMGSQIGVAIAALAMTAAPELLRNLDFLKAVFGEGFDPGEYRLLLFGLAMVLMMIWRPRGLVSVREPSVILKERKSIAGSHVREGHG